jgi:hypothetical protein
MRSEQERRNADSTHIPCECIQIGQRQRNTNCTAIGGTDPSTNPGPSKPGDYRVCEPPFTMHVRQSYPFKRPVCSCAWGARALPECPSVPRAQLWASCHHLFVPDPPPFRRKGTLLASTGKNPQAQEEGEDNGTTKRSTVAPGKEAQASGPSTPRDPETTPQP